MAQFEFPFDCLACFITVLEPLLHILLQTDFLEICPRPVVDPCVNKHFLPPAYFIPYLVVGHVLRDDVDLLLQLQPLLPLSKRHQVLFF